MSRLVSLLSFVSAACLVNLPAFASTPRADGPVEQHDTAPALFADFLELPNQFPSGSGASLSSLVRSSGEKLRDFLRFRSKADRGIRTPAWYLREASTRDGVRHELYVKSDDRWEINDVADRCADIVPQLVDVLNATSIDEVVLPEALTTPVD